MSRAGRAPPAGAPGPHALQPASTAAPCARTRRPGRGESRTGSGRAGAARVAQEGRGAAKAARFIRKRGKS